MTAVRRHIFQLLGRIINSTEAYIFDIKPRPVIGYGKGTSLCLFIW